MPEYVRGDFHDDNGVFPVIPISGSRSQRT